MACWLQWLQERLVREKENQQLSLRKKGEGNLQNPAHCLKWQPELPALTSRQCQPKLSTRPPPILFPHLFHLTLILDTVPDVTLMTCVMMGFGS